MQQLEKYFGFRVTLGKSVTVNDYSDHTRRIAEAFSKAGVNPNGVEVHICQLLIAANSAHFDPSPIHKKLGRMQISLSVNKRNRDDSRMYFLNDKIKHQINEGVGVAIEKFELRYLISGAFFEGQNSFQEVVYVVVTNGIRYRDRRLKVKILAMPSGEFARKLINVASANTKLDFDLDPNTQLKFDL